ncbi:MAG: polymer-forming cytoskeletal protein [Rhodospirillaceae bacterium]|jgi:cytoskeletal protein CcmA (bactofilin family)|nr:polymer-forming cytoskeletal protein [Rhodospirillaceae bacterium]MBT5567191.1 polymer-forming cytoskeletal protein [Rhodospirillaceae bacterium]MBT6089404.1 polymer-forming cytoskeletal protein [Rhodospirillaceae bacterium]MBT6959827.1 polymer-forming cytoskeletal protein [Rhodospirillaceae bacterium]MBT7449924.1 polymer-forming cytoskeletal protein [Rhodospirillaceae bacterium]
MFSSKTNGQSAQVTRMSEAQVKSVPSIISIDLKVQGNLSSNGEIQVDGNVEGDINCKALIVGTKGSVSGEVIAQTVRIHGAIKGQVKAKSVFLASTAQMSGDIEHESLAIEPGAFMEGHCKRTVTEPPKVAKPEPVAVKSALQPNGREAEAMPRAAAS